MPNTPRATDGNENTSVFSAAQPTSQSLTRVSECYEIIETIGFHGLIPYIEALDSVSKIELYNDIRAIRSGTSYISNNPNIQKEEHKEVLSARDKITLFALILGTNNARLFYENECNVDFTKKDEWIETTTSFPSVNKSVPSKEVRIEDCEYHIFLKTKIAELDNRVNPEYPEDQENLNTLQDSDYIDIECLALQILGTIGVTMDATFLLLNKPESEKFITGVAGDLKNFYVELKKIAKPRKDDSERMREFRKDLEQKVTHYSEVLAVNYIVYSGKTTKVEGDEILEAAKKNLVPELCRGGNTDYYIETIGRCNQELFEAKCALTNPENTEDTRRIISTLEARLSTYVKPEGKPAKDTQLLFGREIPIDWNTVNDNTLEVLTAILRLDTEIGTKDILEGIEQIVHNTAIAKQNERESAFTLLLIEAALEKLIIPGRALQEKEITDPMRALSQFLFHSFHGDTMIEEFSRINFLIANVYGRVYTTQLEALKNATTATDSVKISLVALSRQLQLLHANETSEELLQTIEKLTNTACQSVLERKSEVEATFRAEGRWPHLELTGIYGKAAFCLGIRAMGERERACSLSKIFLDAFTQALCLEENFVFIEGEKVYAREALRFLDSGLFGGWSHIEESMRKRQLLLLERLSAVTLPEKLRGLEEFTTNICSQISEYFYGFFKVHIVPYGSRQPSLGDIVTQSFDIGFGFELILESDSLKENSRNTFSQKEIPEIKDKITELIELAVTNICPIKSKDKLDKIKLFPQNSNTSYAIWLMRIIGNSTHQSAKPMVFAQEKLILKKTSLSPTDPSKFRIDYSLKGVETLLRMQEEGIHKLITPGPYWPPSETICVGNEVVTIDLFEVLDLFGEYHAFMQEHLEDTLRKMQGLKVHFSVNVRGDELESPEYFSRLDGLLKKYDIDPGRLTIEILEHKINFKDSTVVENLVKFGEVGIGISLDDCGSEEAGESRINTCTELGIKLTEIKLDGKWVDNFNGNKEKLESVMRFIKYIREALPDVDIVIEKVKKDDLGKIPQMFDAGINIIQGYGKHSPEPLEDWAKKKEGTSSATEGIRYRMTRIVTPA